MPREALIKSARAGSERFCPQASFEKWRNTLCISHFSKGRMWAKDPLSSRRRFIQSFPNERKKPSPVNQGKAGKRPHPALRATFPSQGKALYGAVQSCAKRKVCPCEEARRADVALSAPFRGHPSHRERQGPHLSLSVLGAVHSISREMSSAYLRKKSGPLSRNSSTDTPSSSSAWQAGSSRGRPKSPCIRRIR